METLTLEILLFLIAVGFVAAFIDSIVGGGGLISIPALLLAGLPTSEALGTNKLAGTASSLTSTVSFLKSGNMETKLVLGLFPVAFIGAALGALSVSMVPSDFLQPMVVVLLVVITAYTLIKKNWGAKGTYSGLTARTRFLIGAAAFGIGYYDGFFGPGTGSFLIFSFLMLGFDFVRAAGNAKMLNLATNLASLFTFTAVGLVNFAYGIPMALAMIAGAWTGSRFAIKKGTAFVKPLFIAITALLIGKQLYDLLF